LIKNDYDGHTLQSALEQYKRFYDKEPRKAIADLGYRGVSRIGETEKITPSKRAKTKSEKVKLRNDHRRRSSPQAGFSTLEAGISHLKIDHRLNRNFYRYAIGDEINLLLAASAFNFKRMMRK
jgi:IS5 family transposase